MLKVSKVLLFKKKTWTPFETAIRIGLIQESRKRDMGMTELLTTLVRNNQYPPNLETPYKIHTVLKSLFNSELVDFKEKYKEKLVADDEVNVSNLYFLHHMSLICKDYGINMTEIAKK